MKGTKWGIEVGSVKIESRAKKQESRGDASELTLEPR